MFVVLKYDEARHCSICVNADGTTTDKLKEGELYPTRGHASKVAWKYDGEVIEESRLPNLELDEE